MSDWVFTLLLVSLGLAGSTGTAEVPACPHLLFVAGNRDYPYVEGLYSLQMPTSDSHPIYRHSCHDIFLYHEQQSATWWIGPEVGGSTGYALLYSSSLSPVTRGGRDSWRYWKYSASSWVYDNDARMICLDLSCQRLELDGEDLPDKTRISYQLTDMIHHDRPVYQSQDGGLYIYHGQLSVACNVWFLGTTVGSEEALMFVYDSARAPHNIKTRWTVSDRVTRYSEHGVTYREALNVSIQCTEASMYDVDTTSAPQVRTSQGEIENVTTRSNDTPLSTSSTPSRECGRVAASKSGLVSQIISGRNSSFQGKWPWMVAILKSNNETKCGAAIISSKYLITAAHCIDGSNSSLSSYQLLMGANNRAINEKYTQRYRIKRTILHDNFTFSTRPFRLKNDVGIIEIEGEIEFTPYVRPVCLPDSSTPNLPYSNVQSAFEECFIIGFGNYHVDASGSSSISRGVLQEQVVSIETISSCSRRYFSAYAWLPSTKNICVRPANYGKLCQGDSGSPLMCRSGDQWTLVGVASWSFAACISGSVPSVYVDVTRHGKWIAEQIGT